MGHEHVNDEKDESIHIKEWEEDKKTSKIRHCDYALSLSHKFFWMFLTLLHRASILNFLLLSSVGMVTTG